MAKNLTLRTSAHVDFFRRGDEVFLYHNLVGYIIGMDERVMRFLRAFGAGRDPDEVLSEFEGAFPKDEMEQFLSVFREHGCLVETSADEEQLYVGLYPVKGPWILFHTPDAEPTEVAYKDRRTGEMVVRELDPFEARVWDLAEGALSLREIAEQLEQEFLVEDILGRVERFVYSLTHSDKQLLKLAELPLYEFGHDRPPYLQSTMPYPRVDDARPRAGDDLHRYHREEIKDPSEQFETNETTLSHMFRVPHPALAGLTYGQAFARAIIEEKLIPAGARVLEVGGGIGLFARDLLQGLKERAPAAFETLVYTVLDLSPALQASQRKVLEPFGDRVRFLSGEATRLPLADASLDLLVSNEVIADLEVAKLSRDRVDSLSPEQLGASEDEALRAIARYKLIVEDAPPEFFLNVGAFRFVEEAARVLKPGGAAVITEYGDVYRYPVESTHLDHAEFSIHFGHLILAASGAGFTGRLKDVVQFLGMEPMVKVLATNRTLFEVLRAFLARKGVKLEKIAYTEAMLKSLLAGKVRLSDLHGLSFLPVGERALGLRPREFKALVLRKPAPAPAAAAPGGPAPEGGPA